LPTEMRSIASLYEHELNRCMFPQLSELELRLLADDMQLRGLQHAIEILPDGRIVCGYHRWAAAKLLGWQEIRCIVHYALAERGEEAVLEHLVADNEFRRQIDPLGQAQLWDGLRQAIKKAMLAGKDTQLLSDLRDRVAQLTNQKSERHLNRDLRILKNAPVEVIDAVRKGRLTKKDATAVTHLTKPQQAEVARRIAAGEKPAVVVRSYAEPRSFDTRVSTMAKNLRRRMQDLVNRKQASLGAAYDDMLAKARDIEKQVDTFLDKLNGASDPG
jgi:ParB-like chromosome segregation protein Spo0J